MIRSRGLPAALLLLAALAGAVVAARESRAGDPVPKRARIDLTCTGEAVPAQVAPGGRGELVLRARLRDHVHVNADETFSVLPVARGGVTYGAPVLSASSLWTDPSYPDLPPIPVWFGTIEVRIPFTLSADATLPLHVGATLKWTACDEHNCYPLDKLPAPVLVEIVAPTGSAAPAAPDGPDPSGPAPTPPAPTLPGTGPQPPVGPPPAEPPTSDGGEPRTAPHPPGMEEPVPVPAGSAPLLVESKVATLALSVAGDEVRILFTPAGPYHLYAPGAPDSDPIRVEGSDAPGTTWKPAIHPALDTGEVHDPYEVRLPFVRAADAQGSAEFLVHWQGCSEFGVCDRPTERRFALERLEAGYRVVEAAAVARPKPPAPVPAEVPGSGMDPSMSPVPPSPAPGAPSTPPVPPVAPPLPPPGPTIGPVAPSGLLFPEIGTSGGESYVEGLWRRFGLLFLGPIFLAGIFLAFTPCVLPLIPITVSLVGGAHDTPVSRGRMTLLLSSYVLGLALAFGVLGLAASFGGASLSAAFKSPVARWGIAGLFVVLAFGMFGVYEMQPPAALQRLLGTAKGGSVVGSFLFGALSSVIASPCTGPVIIGMLLFAAQSGSVLLGFLMFFTLGLGMGAVLFAAGSVHLLLKPGPWMVWVRHGFGVVLVGVGLYYLANAGDLPPPYLFAAGFAVALAAAVGIARHLVRREGEDAAPAAGRGAAVAVLLVVATGAVAFLTRVPSASALPAGSAAARIDLSWTPVATRAELVAEVARARREGKAVVVDVWAPWCTYCKLYDRVIEDSAALRTAFGALHRLRIRVDTDDHVAVRDGLGIPAGAQPYFVFLDREGRIVRPDVEEWKGGGSEAELLARVKALGASR